MIKRKSPGLAAGAVTQSVPNNMEDSKPSIRESLVLDLRSAAQRMAFPVDDFLPEIEQLATLERQNRKSGLDQTEVERAQDLIREVSQKSIKRLPALFVLYGIIQLLTSLAATLRIAWYEDDDFTI